MSDGDQSLPVPQRTDGPCPVWGPDTLHRGIGYQGYWRYRKRHVAFIRAPTRAASVRTDTWGIPARRLSCEFLGRKIFQVSAQPTGVELVESKRALAAHIKGRLRRRALGERKGTNGWSPARPGPRRSQLPPTSRCKLFLRSNSRLPGPHFFPLRAAAQFNAT